jgi:hypothetical protein
MVQFAPLGGSAMTIKEAIDFGLDIITRTREHVYIVAKDEDSARAGVVYLGQKLGRTPKNAQTVQGTIRVTMREGLKTGWAWTEAKTS